MTNWTTGYAGGESKEETAALRSRSSIFRPVALALSVAALAGCPATSEEVRPPDNQFYFPTGMALSPDKEVLFVTNANSDLRFDSGMVTPVVLDEVEGIVRDWVDTAELPSGLDCELDPILPYTLICTEAEVILADSTVRVGNFSTDVAVQELDSGDARLFVAVRGDPSLTWIDYDPDAEEDRLSCGGNGEIPQCDEEHRLTHLREDPKLVRLTSEPFEVFVDSENEYVLITHLTQGAVSLADAPADGSMPVLADGLGGLFNPHPVTGVRGAVGVAGRAPGMPGDLVYVTSRSEARIQMLSVARLPGSYPILLANDFFFLNQVNPSDDARGIAFSEDGERAYVVNRSPPMLHVVDTSLNDLGRPRNEFLGGVELCQQASNLTVAETGRGERIYVACFRDGQVWSIDPKGMVVEAITDVGRGPHALVVAEERELLFVTNFLEDTVAVVDLQPGSPLENRVAFQIGRARQSGGDPELEID